MIKREIYSYSNSKIRHLVSLDPKQTADKSEQVLKDIISKVVWDFYSKATSDFLIGYQFRKIINQQESPDPLRPPVEQFSEHIPKIIHFWELQLLSSPYNKKKNSHLKKITFDLIDTHQKLSIRKGELARWVLLFYQTLEGFHERHRNEQQICTLLEVWRKKIHHFDQKFKNIFFT